MGRFGDGLAADADLLAAAERAARQATDTLGGRRPDLAMVFVCGADPDELGAAAGRAGQLTGARFVLGCAAPGVIGAGRAVEAASAVAVWCGVLPGVRLRTFHLEVMPTAGSMAVVGLPERHDEDAVAIVLADPWSFPIDGFIERTAEALGELPVVGGLASGLRGRGSTRLLLDDRVLDRGAVGVVLSGPVGARTIVSQGCRPIGPAMTVTGSDGNVLLSLAGTPAKAKLEEILVDLDVADQALAGTGLQIGLAMDEYAEAHGQGDYLVRGIAGIDEHRDGLVIGDLVEVGQTVQFQLRDASAADDELRTALKMFRESTTLDTVEGALLFTCNGRGAAMFADAAHDVTVVREELAAAHGVAGFFAAGELAPVGGRNHVHGTTAVVLAFGSGAHGR
jgi:small ligand-binding sensory domain FIST